ncbi:ATP-grasp domain-containing protein [Streptomyces mirabilis]|uniref:ATP-grasp domain-containing protein n=1 Tax=Streptomyces mirabilis TaxID=68239 RepID=UPI0036A86980
MKRPALIINRQPHRWLFDADRCLVPLAELEPHLVTHTDGGLDGLDPTQFPHTYVCALQDDDEWSRTCEWIAREHRIERIIAPNERFLLLAARLRTTLGLPGIQHHTARLFRDKLDMKRTVQAASVPVPDFTALDAREQITPLDWHTTPKVIKRRDYVGAMDIHVVHSAEHALQVWDQLAPDPGRYEIETYVDGDLYHCDAVVHNATVAFASSARYTVKPGDFRRGGMGGSTLTPPGPLRDRIYQLNAQVISALGLQDGVTHLEVFHTPDDELVFCEVAARPGGGFIDLMNRRAHGVNLTELAILLEAGLPIPALPHSSTTTARTWGWLGFFPDGDNDNSVPAEAFTELGIVEHRHDPRPTGAPRHASDFRDEYLYSAPDETSFHKLTAQICDAYTQSARRPELDHRAA